MKSSSSLFLVIGLPSAKRRVDVLAVAYFLGTTGGLELSMLFGMISFRSSSSSLDEVSSISGLHYGSKRRDDQFRLTKPRDFSNLVASCQFAVFLEVSS